MVISCNRCEQAGFLNLHQANLNENKSHEEILQWIRNNEDHDVQVCDCCGDGERWFGEPGEHYNNDDLPGKDGVYGYNGGLCECH